MQTAWFQFRNKPMDFQSRRRQQLQLCPHGQSQDISSSRTDKTWKGLSFRVMALNGGMLGGG